jgi:hypothetical protein
MRQEQLEAFLLSKGFTREDEIAFVIFIKENDERVLSGIDENYSDYHITSLEKIVVEVAIGRVTHFAYYDGNCDKDFYWTESICDLIIDIESDSLYVKKFLL